AKEAAYRAVESGSYAAALTSSQGETLKKLAEDLSEAERHFADVRVTYGAKHPEYPKAQAKVAELEKQLDQAQANVSRRAEVEFGQAQNREQMLEAAVAQTKKEFDDLNARS